MDKLEKNCNLIYGGSNTMMRSQNKVEAVPVRPGDLVVYVRNGEFRILFPAKAADRYIPASASLLPLQPATVGKGVLVETQDDKMVELIPGADGRNHRYREIGNRDKFALERFTIFLVCWHP